MKRCATCKVKKALAYFCRVSKARGGGLGTECKKCANARSVAWRKEHPAQAKMKVNEWRAAHPEQRRAGWDKWRKENPDRRRVTCAKWSQGNLAWGCMNAARRIGRILQATPGWTNHIAIGEIYSFAAIKTKLTGEPWHVDHIVPLRSKLVCGLHTHYNLQGIPKAENHKKNNRYWPDMPEVAHG